MKSVKQIDSEIQWCLKQIQEAKAKKYDANVVEGFQRSLKNLETERFDSIRNIKVINPIIVGPYDSEILGI